MKHLRRILAVAAFVFPLALQGQVFADSTPDRADKQQSVTHELHVTAIVPDRREIIIDRRGNILTITSNTAKDVTPEVYLLKNDPKNKRQLSPELHKQYRAHVPEGSGNAGILYEAEFPKRLTVAGSRGWL